MVLQQSARMATLCHHVFAHRTSHDRSSTLMYLLLRHKTKSTYPQPSQRHDQNTIPDDVPSRMVPGRTHHIQKRVQSVHLSCRFCHTFDSGSSRWVCLRKAPFPSSRHGCLPPLEWSSHPLLVGFLWSTMPQQGAGFPLSPRPAVT